MAKSQPPLWSPDELEAGRLQALANFIGAWGADGTRRYDDLVRQYSEPLRRLFAASADLTDLSGAVFVRDTSLVNVARFLTAPPVSADDLRTLVGGSLNVAKPAADRAERAARIIKAAWDPIRFPWLAAGRPPTPQERDVAIVWTASIYAIESMRTHQRNAPARAQEARVSETLMAAGFGPVATRDVDALEDIPRGSFSQAECRLGDHKADRAVRLRDGRLLAIECKVSNSTVNSKKRLNNDVGAKAADWQRSYGSQIVTAAVLSGVYSLGNLVTAQDRQHITLFWSHDLAPLAAFVSNAT